MTTYYAKNATMNLTDANAWNTAANGSGTDWTYEAGAHILDANGKAITLDADVSVTRLQNTSGVGGYYLITASATRNIVADLTVNHSGARTPIPATCLLSTLAGQTVNITGNLTAANLYSVTLLIEGGTVTINGGGTASGIYSFSVYQNGGTLTWTGSPTTSGYGRCYGGVGGTASLNGTFSSTSASSTAIYVDAAANTTTLTGKVYTTKNSNAAIVIGGTLNWKNQSVSLAAGEHIYVNRASGTLDITGLTIQNSGKVVFVNDDTGTFTTTGARVYNRTPLSQAAGINCTLAVVPFSAPVFGGRVFRR
jgi:hypothetical protein